MDTQKEYIRSLDPENRPAYGTVEELESFITPEAEQVPQTDSEKLDEILSLLRPLAPALRALPEVVEQVGPIIDGLKKSPVLKALGVRIP